MQAPLSRRRALVGQGYNPRVENMRKDEYPQLRGGYTQGFNVLLLSQLPLEYPTQKCNSN